MVFCAFVKNVVRQHCLNIVAVDDFVALWNHKGVLWDDVESGE